MCNSIIDATANPTLIQDLQKTDVQATLIKQSSRDWGRALVLYFNCWVFSEYSKHLKQLETEPTLAVFFLCVLTLPRSSLLSPSASTAWTGWERAAHPRVTVFTPGRRQTLLPGPSDPENHADF